MATFTNILVPTDFSEYSMKALETAMGLAADLGASFRVAHVGAKSTVREAVKAGLIAAGDDDDALERKIRERRVAAMESFLSPLGESSPAIQTVYLSGEPANEIVCYARDNGVDLVVMGRRGVTLGNVILGSVAERVVRHAPCPVMIVRRS